MDISGRAITKDGQMNRLLRMFLAVSLSAVAAAEPVRIPSETKFLGSIWKPASRKDGAILPNPHTTDPLFGTLFRQITPENCGKWGCVERVRGTYTWEPLDQMFAFAAQRGLHIRHHGFVWGMQQPDWIAAEADVPAAVDRWMQAFYSRYGPQLNRVLCIEAVNEPLSQPAPYRDKIGGAGQTGWDCVIWTYERSHHHARAARLAPKHILNEWGVETPGPKANRFREICQLLVDRKLIDYIGVQGHFLGKASATLLPQGLDDLASLGVPLFVTEFELNIPDDQAHLEKFQELFPVYWEHPSVIGVTFWGHQEGQMWRPSGYLVHKDGSERPALTWLRQYLAHRGHAWAMPQNK